MSLRRWLFGDPPSDRVVHAPKPGIDFCMKCGACFRSENIYQPVVSVSLKYLSETDELEAKCPRCGHSWKKPPVVKGAPS